MEHRIVQRNRSQHRLGDRKHQLEKDPQIISPVNLGRLLNFFRQGPEEGEHDDRVKHIEQIRDNID
ncbi:hypothetical protein D3C73_1292430 [compost metagenome]